MGYWIMLGIMMLVLVAMLTILVCAVFLAKHLMTMFTKR
jgi:hypothetical protein